MQTRKQSRQHRSGISKVWINKSGISKAWAYWMASFILGVLFAATAAAQSVTTTTVQGTVYTAAGQPASGTLQISWPAFTTAAGQAVAAGRTTVPIGADGFVSVNLAPNLGSMPAGLYYTVIYNLSDGTVNTEYWTVPAAAQATIGAVRAQVMPAAQAIQAVNKAYVDEQIQNISQSTLGFTGGTLSGPLYLSGDPSQPNQAADKHYVDDSFAQAIPLSGGSASGPLTAVKLGGAYQVDQYTGADFGGQLQACINSLNTTYGGTCDARNFTGALTMGSNVTISTANVTVNLPCATISTSNQILVTAGTRNVTFHGCALLGSSSAGGNLGGTVFVYSGTGAMFKVGDSTYATDTVGFHIDNTTINVTNSTNASTQAIAIYRTQEIDLDHLYLLGNANQTAITLDGTGNYTGGSLSDDHISGFLVGLNAIGHQITNSATTDWVNATAFLRLHVDCPTSSESQSGNGTTPDAGTIGINLVQGDGNTFTGGDIENCSTALHLGANAQNNTIVGLRNENSTMQVQADSGSQYNSWITAGTMFTGKLTDNGTHNSFWDSFHRGFNGVNGDIYRSQADSTVTDHQYLGVGNGNVRGRQTEYVTDVPGTANTYQNAWLMGLSDGSTGLQTYQVEDLLNNVNRISVGQYNNGSSTNNQTVLNSAGTGAVVLNGSNNAGTGGVVIGSGGSASSTVATINNSGNAQFNGTLLVGSTAQSAGTMTVRNNADAEVDYYLQPGLTASQKGSFTYKDYNGNSQWYLLKDASNNWALNSAPGNIDILKAYQNTNSGDTYLDTSNSSGHIRLNYETGAGSETDIYSGGSSNLDAAFLSPTAIKFPGLAAGNSKYCLQVDNSGYITNTGSPCGTGASSATGTINTGTQGQVAIYSATGSGTALAAVTSTTASAALASLGAQPAMSGVVSDGNSGIQVTGGVAAQTSRASVNNVINVMAPPYNAQCNLRQFAKGSIPAGSTTLTGYGFSSVTAGETIVIWGAGANQGSSTNPDYAPLVTTVASIGNNTTLTLATAAITTVPNAASNANGDYEIGTNDTSAIQSAYNAAAAANETVLIPANAAKSCLIGALDLSAGNTTSSIAPIEGQGSLVSSLTGLPGEDVLQWPDGRKSGSGYSTLKGLQINVDSSIDVSCPSQSSCPSTGNSQTSYGRLTGEAANGSGGLTPVTPAISPGPVAFTNGAISQSSDGTYDELTITPAVDGSYFDQLPQWMIVGQQVSIPSLNYTGTISSFVSQTQVTVSPAYTAPASNLSGTWGAGLAPPWYVGNCGLAFPMSNGSTGAGMEMIFDDLNFQTVGGPPFANHTCAMFLQGPPYWSRFTRITAQNFYYGYLEALPVTNNNITWTPDTSTYHDINLNTLIPFVQYAGNHRILDGISIYAANHPLSLGPFLLNGPKNSAGNSTVTHFYHECWSDNTGENQRWQGTEWNIEGGSLTQCGGPYVNWQASASTIVDTQIGNNDGNTNPAAYGLQLTGNLNDFENVGISNAVVNDMGLGNRVKVTYVSNFALYTPVYANNPTCIPGEMDASFLNGFLGTPYTSRCGLFLWYANTSINGSSGYQVSSTMSTTGDGNPFPAWWTMPNTANGVVQINAIGEPLSTANRLPASANINLLLYGRVTTAGTQTVSVFDNTANTTIKTCTLAMTTTNAVHGAWWSTDACSFSLASVPPADVILVRINASTALGTEQIGYLALLPVPTDPQELVNGSTAATQAASDASNAVATDAFVHNNLALPLSLASGSTATTQAASDTSTNLATDAFVHAALAATALPVKYTVSLTPAAATASACTEQTFTVSGLAAGQGVTVAPPADLGAHLWIGHARVSTANTLAISFCADATGGTPPSGSYILNAQ